MDLSKFQNLKANQFFRGGFTSDDVQTPIHLMGTRGSSNICTTSTTPALMPRGWEVKWMFSFLNTCVLFICIWHLSLFCSCFCFYSYLSILAQTGSITHALLVSHISISNHDVSQALLIAQWWNLLVWTAATTKSLFGTNRTKLKGNNNQMVSSLRIRPTLQPFWLLASSWCKNIGRFLARVYSISKVHVCMCKTGACAF